MNFLQQQINTNEIPVMLQVQIYHSKASKKSFPFDIINVYHIEKFQIKVVDFNGIYIVSWVNFCMM
jgi:hypothetical protein